MRELPSGGDIEAEMAVRSNYPRDEVEACSSVLLEIVTVLGEFSDSIVVVGGSVPPLLFPSPRHGYVGTLDVDLALDFRRIGRDTYKTIVQALQQRGYYQRMRDQPYVFRRNVTTRTGVEVTVEIDLLAAEYGGAGRGHRHQRVQDAQARKARGCDLVFDDYETITLKGTLPNGAVNEVSVRVSGIGAFLAMKGMALWERLKEKDCYDIYYCCTNYPGGVEALARSVQPGVQNALMREGLGKIRSKFASLDALGPVGVVHFLEITDPEERNRVQREAYELVNALMDKLAIEPFLV